MAEVDYLFLIAHGSTSSDHDLAARLLFQLLCCHTSGSQNPADKIKLQKPKECDDIVATVPHFYFIESKEEKKKERLTSGNSLTGT